MNILITPTLTAGRAFLKNKNINPNHWMITTGIQHRGLCCHEWDSLVAFPRTDPLLIKSAVLCWKQSLTEPKIILLMDADL